MFFIVFYTVFVYHLFDETNKGREMTVVIHCFQPHNFVIEKNHQNSIYNWKPFFSKDFSIKNVIILNLWLTSAKAIHVYSVIYRAYQIIAFSTISFHEKANSQYDFRWLCSANIEHKWKRIFSRWILPFLSIFMHYSFIIHKASCFKTNNCFICISTECCYIII